MYLVFTPNWGHNKKVKIIYKEEINNDIQSKIGSMYKLYI